MWGDLEEEIIRKLKFYEKVEHPSDEVFEIVCRVAIDALQKQIPKKVLNRKEFKNLSGKVYTIRGDCPVCYFEGILSPNTCYCPDCGQRLSWDLEGY